MLPLPNVLMLDKMYFFINLFFIIHIVNCDDVPGNELGDGNTTVPGPLLNSTKSYVFWPKGIIPFYIDNNHYDNEQQRDIRLALSKFILHTCLKFAPVLAPPRPEDHVLVFENPTGTKKCGLSNEPHHSGGPHRVTVGYECLRSPNIDMMVMRALGFPFEHNRFNRELYIDVMPENVEPGYMELFTKDSFPLPLELKMLDYDTNSVLHFGERDYSKNGHRTIVFKKEKYLKVKRNGLSKTDVRKIEVVYGKECRDREKTEKKEICQTYPQPPKRRRRMVTGIPVKSLRVNPDITPPEVVIAKAEDNKEFGGSDVDAHIRELGIESQVEYLVEEVHKVAAAALVKARDKYCNGTKPSLRTAPEMERPKSANILRIIQDTASYAKALVDKAVSNLTEFCAGSKSIDDYQRSSCPFFDKSRCQHSYKSTKIGAIRASTQHRPVIPQSTKHQGSVSRNVYVSMYRTGNNTDEAIPVHVLESGPTTVKVEAEKAKTNASTFPDLKSMVSKSDLRMGTRVVFEKKKIFAPNYRASESSSASTKGRRKRDVIDVEGNKNETKKPARRSYEHHRFRTKLNSTLKSKHHKKEYEKTWESSKVSMETTKKPVKAKKSKLRAYLDHETDQINDYGGDFEEARDHREVIPRKLKLSKRVQEFYDERKWPDNTVRYIIKDTGDFDVEDVRNRIEEVSHMLRKQTCVTLQEITEEDEEKYEDYLVLDDSPDYVTGRVGGKQPFGVVELLRGGQHRQHTAMMVMAMLGFYFEISRHDRDKYIRVHMRHVRPDKLHHFEKIREDATFPLPYDYKSATHPAWQFWRQIGRTGISTVATFKDQDPNGKIMKSLGQNEPILSDLDLVKINTVYGTECFEEDQEQGPKAAKEAGEAKEASEEREAEKKRGKGRKKEKDDKEVYDEKDVSDNREVNEEQDLKGRASQIQESDNSS